MIKRLFPILIVALVCMGCTRRVYVPAEKTIYHADSTGSVRLMRDSVVVRDSVFVMLRGDSTVVERYRTIREVTARTDTLIRLRTDTIREPVIVEVEKPGASLMAGWRKWVYWGLMGALAVILVLLRPALKLLKKS